MNVDFNLYNGNGIERDAFLKKMNVKTYFIKPEEHRVVCCCCCCCCCCCLFVCLFVFVEVAQILEIEVKINCYPLWEAFNRPSEDLRENPLRLQEVCNDYILLITCISSQRVLDTWRGGLLLILFRRKEKIVWINRLKRRLRSLLRGQVNNNKLIHLRKSLLLFTYFCCYYYLIFRRDTFSIVDTHSDLNPYFLFFTDISLETKVCLFIIIFVVVVVIVMIRLVP